MTKTDARLVAAKRRIYAALLMECPNETARRLLLIVEVQLLELLDCAAPEE